jgi:hypothetical protein
MNEPTNRIGVSRRTFLKASSATLAVPLYHGAYAAASDRIRVGVIGCGGRGAGAAADAIAADPGEGSRRELSGPGSGRDPAAVTASADGPPIDRDWTVRLNATGIGRDHLCRAASASEEQISRQEDPQIANVFGVAHHAL